MDTDALISQIAAKVGISEEQAKQVVDFLVEHKDDIIKMLGSDTVENLKSKIPGGLGGLLG